MTVSSGRGRSIWRGPLPLRIALVSGGLSLLVASAASASELSWEGPAGCASRDALSFELERALGVPLESAGRLKFHVRVERSKSMASARLEVSSVHAPEDRAKQRLLVADDCSTLVDTLAIAIGLAIGASEMQRSAVAAGVGAGAASSPAASLEAGTPRAQTSSSPPDDQRADEPADEPARDDESRRSAGLRPSVFLDVVGDGGALPHPALGATLGLAFHGQRVAARASGTLLLDQSVRLASPERSGGAELGLRFGTLQGCTDVLGALPRRWTLPLCAGVDVGQLWGEGVGVARARRATSWWIAPRLDAGLFWAIPGTTLRAGGWLTASAPLQRDEFVVDEVGAVHRPGPLVGRLAVGIDASLE
jgi:hypothetical protein